MDIYELKERIDMYVAKGCKGEVLLYDEETKRVLDLCSIEYVYDLVEANTEGVVILAKEFIIHDNSKHYSVCIFDKRKDYDSRATIDVGEYIKLDLWGGETLTLPITKVEVCDNKDINITFNVPELLYDNFKNNGEKDFYDIHFDYVKINGEINNEWEW